MIASLRGTVVETEANLVVIEAGGVGFGVQTPARMVSLLSRRVGEETHLHTYLHVRDDALQLFGFESRRERAFFLSLIAISGVGPKVAMAMLSTYPVEDLEAAVVRGDARRFESVSGVGKKLAQRLIIELKDKVAGELEEALHAGVAGDESDPFIQARIALQNLGLSLREAETALKGAPDGAGVEELVRHALHRETDA